MYSYDISQTANSNGADQPAHVRSLIRAFAVHMLQTTFSYDVAHLIASEFYTTLR